MPKIGRPITKVKNKNYCRGCKYLDGSIAHSCIIKQPKTSFALVERKLISLNTSAPTSPPHNSNSSLTTLDSPTTNTDTPTDGKSPECSTAAAVHAPESPNSPCSPLINSNQSGAMSASEISAEATRALSPTSESSHSSEIRPQEINSPAMNSPTTAGNNSSNTTDEAWQLVTKIFRPRPTQTCNQPQTQALPINNRYQALTPRVTTAPQPTPAVNMAGNTPPSAAAPRASAPRPRESVGEIVIEQPIDVTALMSALRPHLTMPLGGIPSQNFVTLKPGCVKDHHKIVSELTRMQSYSQHVQFFFRRATEERRHRLVIRGLRDSEDLTAIQSDLSFQGVTVHHISEMKRACYSETGAKSFISLGLYVIEINHREIPLTRTITTILNQIIRWEEYRGRDRVPHCKRCQLWGHSHNGCRRNAVCLYCAGAHSIENCNKPENPRCANCGSNHVASFHECPALLTYKEARARQLGGARQTRAAAQLATRMNSLALIALQRSSVWPLKCNAATLPCCGAIPILSDIYG